MSKIIATAKSDLIKITNSTMKELQVNINPDSYDFKNFLILNNYTTSNFNEQETASSLKKSIENELTPYINSINQSKNSRDNLFAYGTAAIIGGVLLMPNTSFKIGAAIYGSFLYVVGTGFHFKSIRQANNCSIIAIEEKDRILALDDHYLMQGLYDAKSTLKKIVSTYH